MNLTTLTTRNMKNSPAAKISIVSNTVPVSNMIINAAKPTAPA